MINRLNGREVHDVEHKGDDRDAAVWLSPVQVLLGFGPEPDLRAAPQVYARVCACPVKSRCGTISCLVGGSFSND